MALCPLVSSRALPFAGVATSDVYPYTRDIHGALIQQAVGIKFAHDIDKFGEHGLSSVQGGLKLIIRAIGFVCLGTLVISDRKQRDFFCAVQIQILIGDFNRSGYIRSRDDRFADKVGASDPLICALAATFVPNDNVIRGSKATSHNLIIRL